MARKGGFFKGAFWGALVAGAGALLYAPKKGEELRKDLKVELDNLKERASDYSDYVVEKGVEYADAASAATEDIRVNLKQQAGQLKQQFDEFSKDASAKVSDLAQEATDNWDKVKENLSDMADKGAEVVTEFKENISKKTDAE